MVEKKLKVELYSDQKIGDFKGRWFRKGKVLVIGRSIDALHEALREGFPVALCNMDFAKLKLYKLQEKR